MRVLRYAALVALVVWVGGLMTLGLLVAPTAFDVVEARHVESGRMLAGYLFGAMFERFHFVGYSAAVVLLISLVLRRLLGPKPVHVNVRFALLAAMLGATLYSGLILTKEVQGAQAALGAPSSTLPEGDPRRVEFERLHGRSVWVVVATVVAGFVLLAYEAVEN